MKRFTLSMAACAALILVGCSAPADTSSLTAFQTHLQNLCGNTYEGQVTSSDPQDEDWRKEVLTLGPVSCPNGDTTVLPLAVGDDKTRVWTLTLQDKAKPSTSVTPTHSKTGPPIRLQDMAASQRMRIARPPVPSFRLMPIPKRILRKTASKHR